MTDILIPIGGKGRRAIIPREISEDDFDLILATLDLWKNRIIKKHRKPILKSIGDLKA